MGDSVELLVEDRWNYGAHIAEVILRRKRDRRSDEFTYTVTAGPNKAWFNVGPARLRQPTLYPTRKAVWTLQSVYSVKLPNSKTETHWFPCYYAFEQGNWNHGFQHIMRIVKMKHDKLQSTVSSPTRVFNYQTKEVIPLEALHLDSEN